MEEDEEKDTPSSTGSRNSSSSNRSARARTRQIYGVGRPVLGYRNVAAYAQAREGPDTRFLPPPGGQRRGGLAYSQATLLQRWQPDLMLDTDTMVELLKEDWDERPARRREGMERQGNALWIPSLPPMEQQQQQQQQRRHLLVHAGGPVMDRLCFSWLEERRSSSSRGNEEEEEEEGDEEEEEGRRGRSRYLPKCAVRGGGMWVPGEVGSIRQIAPLNQYEPAAATAAAAAAATCFIRGTTEAALFQLQSQQQQQQSFPFLLTPLQKLQFQHPLLDIATRPSSLHRCAFLTDHLEIFEWTSAAGATRLNFHLLLPPSFPPPEASSSRSVGGGESV